VRRRPSPSANSSDDRSLTVTSPRNAVRTTRRRPGTPEPGEATRRTRSAHNPGPRAGRRHQLRAEQCTSADGLGGRTRRRGVPRAPRPTGRRGHQIGGPQASRPSPRPLGRQRRPQSRHSP